MMQHPIGTRLYFVPIRFWEDHPIETGCVALHKGVKQGEIWDSFTKDGFVYAFHDHYGHDVYMKGDSVFLTEADALARKAELAAQKKQTDDAEFEVVWQKICKELKI